MSTPRQAATKNFAYNVAEHYNNVEQKSHIERRKSNIIGIREFNNAMKSLLIYLGIKNYVVVSQSKDNIRILDLSCGKGGDLLKYQKVGAKFVAGADIADVSIDQCKVRYAEMIKRSNPKYPCFESKFFVSDLTRTAIKETDLEHNELFGLAFAQFSIHYSFESYEQAIRYIKNAADNLEPRGLFIGSYPDGPKLLKLARESKTPGTYELGGDILKIEFKQEDMKTPKAFGTKYHFKLKEVVDCPEFLVHPKILEKLLQDCGFFKVYDRSFEEQLKETNANSSQDSTKLFDFFHRYKVLKSLGERERDGFTFDETTWKVVSLYRCFMYRKI